MVQRDDRGNPERLCVIMRDISEYKKTEGALRESEMVVQRLVKNVNEFAVCMLSVDGLITSWNLGAERILGYEISEIIGKHFSVFYTMDQKESDRPGQLLREAAKQQRLEEEGWRVRKDGSRF